MEGIKPSEYNPKPGEANRYENSLINNKELAEQINKEALNEVNRTMPVLQKIEMDPNNWNFHDTIAGSRWMGHFLQDQQKKIFDLYGVSALNNLDHINIPMEVFNFLMRIDKVMYLKSSKENEEYNRAAEKNRLENTK